jgi:hypothetical protein
MTSALDSSSLSRFERASLSGGPELARALEWVARKLAVFPEVAAPSAGEVLQLLGCAQFYGSFGWDSRPANFFEAVSAPAEVKVSELASLEAGSVLDLTFSSSYRYQFSAYRRDYQNFPENQTVYARWWRHTAAPRGLVYALHPWGMGDVRVSSLTLGPGQFYKQGFDVVLIELPFHGRRSAQMRVDFTPLTQSVRINEAIGQAIADLRCLRLWMEQQRRVPSGTLGMSLGAYIGGLWGSLDRLDFNLALAPMVSLSELSWTLLRSTRSIAALKSSGLSRDLLQRAFNVHDLFSYQSQVPRAANLIVAGLADPYVPAPLTKRLWQHWQQPSIRWVRGGHVAHLRRSQVFDEVIGFLCTALKS